MIYKKLFEHDLKLKKLYHKNCLYIALVLCLYLPIFTDILITIVKTEHIEENKTLRWFTYFSSMLSCFIPLIVSVFRILQGLVRINWLHKYFKKRKMLKELQDTGKAITNNLTVSLTMEDDFERLERMALQNFMRDIFVGLSYCFENSIESDTYPNDDYMQHKITTESYKKILEDETIPQNSYLNVQFIEYAPQTFYDIRNNEDIDYHEMAKSFLPMYNQAGIRRSEGKSGTFFISTDDNKYMIKTLKYEELDIIRCKFLKEYAEYVKENKNTLLCPIYGIFKMIMLGGEDEVLIVVMRNLIGDFKDNIICKFDLKGSSFNRKEQFDPERVENKVMKDLNFDEYEKVLMISERKLGHLRSITSKDSKFLAKMELMDYSLFVVKLDLDKETSMAIFGKSIQEKQELAVSSLLGTSQDESITIRESLASVLPDNDKYKFYRKYLFSSLHSGKAYLIAIIDYFQYYNFAKLMETNYKSIIHPREDNSISCVRPDVYSERFIKFIEKITDVKGFINENNPNSSNEINSTERRNSNEQ